MFKTAMITGLLIIGFAYAAVGTVLIDSRIDTGATMATNITTPVSFGG